MSQTTFSFDLPITPGAIPPVLHMGQYDSGRTYVANLKNDDGTAYSVAASSVVRISGINTAGVAWEQDATFSGSAVTFTPAGAATDQPGKMAVSMTISNAAQTEQIAMLWMIFDIQRAGLTNEEAARSPEFEDAIEAAINERIDAVIPLVVTISQSGQTYSCDTTLAEIQAAIAAGRVVFANVPEPSSGRAYYAEGDANYACLHGIDTSGGGAVLMIYTVTASAVTVISKQLAN